MNLMQQIIQFQKTAADNGFRTTNLLMEHGERLSLAWFDRFSLLPGGTRDTASLWLDGARTCREFTHTAVNSIFEPFEQYKKS